MSIAACSFGRYTVRSTLLFCAAAADDETDALLFAFELMGVVRVVDGWLCLLGLVERRISDEMCIVEGYEYVCGVLVVEAIGYETLVPGRQSRKNVTCM